MHVHAKQASKLTTKPGFLGGNKGAEKTQTGLTSGPLSVASVLCLAVWEARLSYQGAEPEV